MIRNDSWFNVAILEVTTNYSNLSVARYSRKAKMGFSGRFP